MRDFGFAFVQGIVNGSMYGLFALGIVLVYRGTKVINFAAPALGSLGLFTAHVLFAEQGASWVAAAIVGILVAGLTALAFEVLILRRMGDATKLSLAVATIGLLLFIVSFELVAFSASPRNLLPPVSGVAFTIFNIAVLKMQVVAIAVALALGAGLTAFLNRSDFGLGVQAAAMDRDAVRLVGVRLNDINMFVWAVAGMLAVVAAVVTIPMIGGSFAPYYVTRVFFIPSLAAAMVGGLDDLRGAFPGGIVVGLAVSLSKEAFSNTAFVGAEHVTVLASIVLVLLFAPKGVLDRLRPYLSRRSGAVGEVGA